LALRSLFGGIIVTATLFVGVACGDSTGPGGSGAGNQGGDGAGTSADGGSGAGTAGNPPTGGSGAGPIGGNGGAGGEGGQGGAPPNPAPGAPGQAFVSSGNRATSTNYKLVHTTGQSTVNQTTMTSRSYKLQGGLIGATGSQP